MKSSKGFTLIELIVVMAVFMLIVGVTISIFIAIIQNQKRILAQEQLLSQISYTMEYMSKGLRMAKRDTSGSCLVYTDSSYNITETFPGYTYLYTRPSTLYKGIKFINQSNSDACQEFYLDVVNGNNVIKEKKLDSPYDQISDDYSTLLTSDRFDVDYFKISINGTAGLVGDEIYGASEDDTPAQQPRVTISTGFQVPGDTSLPELKIQTTVSQRNLNAK